MDKITRSHVGAARMLDVLVVERARAEPASARRRAARGRAARRPALGARRRAGPADLHRLGDPGRGRGDRRPARAASATTAASRSAASRSSDLPVEAVRRRIVVSEPDPLLFSGTLRERARPVGRAAATTRSSRRSRSRTPRTCSTRCPPGSTTHDRRTRPLVLGRAAPAARPRARPPRRTPRSSCSSSRRARSTRTPRRGSRAACRAARAGRTTVIVTTSPLVLDRADRVVLVDGGRVGRRRHASRAARLARGLPRRPSREGRNE